MKNRNLTWAIQVGRLTQKNSKADYGIMFETVLQYLSSRFCLALYCKLTNNSLFLSYTLSIERYTMSDLPAARVSAHAPQLS